MSDGAKTGKVITRWIFLPDRESTYTLGYKLGQLLMQHPQVPRVIAALGDLGAGKTSFAQGVARGVGVPKETYVNSPTFALHQAHRTLNQVGVAYFHHLDLYRLGDEDELLHLGFEELLDADVCYIEWPQRAPLLLSKVPHLGLRLFHLDEWEYKDFKPEEGRVLTLTATDEILTLISEDEGWSTL